MEKKYSLCELIFLQIKNLKENTHLRTKYILNFEVNIPFF